MGPRRQQFCFSNGVPPSLTPKTPTFQSSFSSSLRLNSYFSCFNFASLFTQLITSLQSKFPSLSFVFLLIKGHSNKQNKQASKEQEGESKEQGSKPPQASEFHRKTTPEYPSLVTIMAPIKHSSVCKLWSIDRSSSSNGCANYPDSPPDVRVGSGTDGLTVGVHNVVLTNFNRTSLAQTTNKNRVHKSLWAGHIQTRGSTRFQKEKRMRSHAMCVYRSLDQYRRCGRESMASSQQHAKREGWRQAHGVLFGHIRTKQLMKNMTKHRRLQFWQGLHVNLT